MRARLVTAAETDRRLLRVLQVRAHYPTLFVPLARFVRRLDSSLTLYDSDLMLASMYCWEKNVFPWRAWKLKPVAAALRRHFQGGGETRRYIRSRDGGFSHR